MADPRAVALDVLQRVRADGAYVNLLLPAAIARSGLAGRDAGLVTELVSGTVRMQGAYDTILAALVAKRPKPYLQDLLRLGSHQLLSMRIPDHAAVSATVALARPGERGFVNAVLRQVAARDFEGWMSELRADLPTRYSHPAWVVERLREALAAEGREHELEALLAADNAHPRVTLVARPGLVSREALLASVTGAPTTMSPHGVVLESGNPAEVAAVREGRAGVQDEGSQLVALALAEATLEGSDRLWLDLCAGPGGKSALLQALATRHGVGQHEVGEHGAALIANEVQPHRAGLVRGNGIRSVVAADGSRPPFAPGTFDRVLVDAPCTGLGALRRRPEARWRKTAEQLGELVVLQRRLLTSALDLVRPGGVVAYATCSPVVEETVGVLEQVMRSSSVGTTVLETRQLWPHLHGTDAMFWTVLRKDAAS